MSLYFSYSFFFFLYHLAMILLCFSMLGGVAYCFSFSMFDFLGLDLTLDFLFDLYSCLFSSTVSLITGVVILYSGYYMSGDMNIKRFCSLLILFVFSMFILIHSSSLLFIMIGWDGLGLISLCLIIYYGGSSVQRSGLVSIYLNRLGDMGLVVGIFLFMDLGFMSGGVLWVFDGWMLIMLFVFSCMTKSAQFPFSSWLPAAMSAPTPISSLVHSSTLVTAGIYLMIRFSPIFFFIYSSLLFSLLSLFTMVCAGLIAVLEQDLKKVIAMSTLSQLGLMMYMLSLGEADYCFFHLLTHAVFKSLLFLSCGGLLLMTFSNQDYRFKSNSVILSPLFSFYFSACSLSLGGMTFLSGFYSKDLCLDSLYEMNSGAFYVFVFYFGCILTLVYSLQLFFVGLSSSSFLAPAFQVSFSFIYCFPLLVLFVMTSVLGKMVFFVFFLEEFDFSFSLMKLVGLTFFFLSGLICYMGANNMIRTPISLSDYLVKMLFLDLVFGGVTTGLIKYSGPIDSLDLTWVELISVNFYLNSLNDFGGWILLYCSLGKAPKSIFLILIYILIIMFFYL